MSRKHTQFLDDVRLLLTLSLLPMMLGMGLGIYSDFEIPFTLERKSIIAFIIILFAPIILDVIIHCFSVNIKDMGASIVLMSAQASVFGFLYSSPFNAMIIEYQHRVFVMVICMAITTLIILLASVMAPKIRQVAHHFEEFSSVLVILFRCCLLVFLLLSDTIFCVILSFYMLFSAINKIHYITEGNGDDEDSPIYIAIHSFAAAGSIALTVILTIVSVVSHTVWNLK